MKNSIRVLLNKFITISLTIVIISVTFAGCTKRLSVPVYEKTDEDGTSVYIDGVRYKQLPQLEWEIDDIDKIIGYAGTYDALVYNFKNDTNRDFILVKYFDTELYGPVLYRTDKAIPDVSVDAVDKIVWEYFEFEPSGNGETYEKQNFYMNTITDKTIIKEFLDLLETGEKTQNFAPIKIDSKKPIINIYMYSYEIPAAYYGLSIAIDNGRIICGKPITGFVYMPDDLVKKIAGKKIDISS